MIHNGAVEKAESMKDKVNIRYGIDLGQMIELCHRYIGRFELAHAAFCLGYMQGMKAAKAELKKAGGTV